MSRGVYKAGDRVPEVGVFWIHHYQHRTSHKARVKFSKFPSCATCGDRVSYEPAMEVTAVTLTWLREDRDFSYAIGSPDDRWTAGA